MSQNSKTYSDVNVEVFTDIPHGKIEDISLILDRIKRTASSDFKTQTGISGINWKDKRVLEAGCGSGYKLLPMGLKGSEIVGVDGSKTQIERITHYADKLGIKNSKFIHGRLEDLALLVDTNSEAGFDLVICSAVLHHVHGWEKLIEDIGKILKEGGVLYLTWCDWSIHLSGFNIKNQISYKLGWNTRSRLIIGKFLFGWWDKKRNTMNVESDSFFADLYSAYYIPMSYRKVSNKLREHNFEITQVLPARNTDQLLEQFSMMNSQSDKIKKFTIFCKKHSWTKPILTLAWRFKQYFMAPKHGPRICVARKRAVSKF